VCAKVDKEKQEDIFVLLVHKQDVVLHMTLAIFLGFSRQLVVMMFWQQRFSSRECINNIFEQLLVEILVPRKSFEGSFIAS